MDTWTLKEDFPDVPNEPVDIEAMQEEGLIDHIGLTLWACLIDTLDGR